MILASEIVKTAYIALNNGWGYIWGTWGEMWTEADQKRIDKTTDANRAKSRKYGSKWIGHMVADCSGLIRWIFNLFGIKVPHSSHYQWTECCKKRGELVNGHRDDGIKIRPGTGVFLRRQSNNKRHHVGLYVGNDTVIEAKGVEYGVVTSSLSHWDEWGEWKDVDYSEYPIEQEDKPVITLRKGMVGDAVKTLQKTLNNLGYDCGEPDGNFGSGTEKAVKNFQKKNGLTDDGVVGPKTWEALEKYMPDQGQDQDQDQDQGPPGQMVVLTMEQAAAIYNALDQALNVLEGVM